ncbi:MAG: VWA domain-containing protein [Candidatus Kapabacteria bacterium]|nr:VWA domain-containing protein [Candidatus Kapabacteria bacterium]
MNSFNIGFSGSVWIYLLLVLIGLGLTLYTYRVTVPPITNFFRTILIILRTLAISLLLFVIFEPILTRITANIVKPKVAVLIDNSLSVALNDSRGNRKQELIKAIDNSGIKDFKEDEIVIAQFDSEVSPIYSFNTDSLKFNGQSTDISKAINWATKNIESQNIQTILMFTDGAFNSGINPIYSTEQFGKPVFVVGIGDSNEAKDISLESIITNEITYVDNPVPVNINLNVNGFEQGEIKVQLLDNNTQIAEQTIKINPETRTYPLLFEYTPKVEGVHKLTAKVTQLQGEITLKNNQISEYIRVLKGKRRIVIFAGSPSPDLTFLRNSLSQDKDIEIKTFVQKQGSEYYESPPTQSEIKDAELIVFVGYPIVSTPNSSLDLIKNELANGKPLLLIASQNLDYYKLKILEDYMPFTVQSTRANEFLVIPDISDKATGNPIIRVNGNEQDKELWNQLPPIFRTETFVRVKPESEIISTFKVNNVPFKEPLIVSRSFQGQKTIAVLGYGIYRWKLLGYAAEVAKGRKDAIDLFDIFVQNSRKWLSVNQERKNVVIKTNKKFYVSGEKISFIAQVYDAAYNFVDNATVNVKIQSSNEQRDLILVSMGNGRYTADVSGLREGDYSFKGSASLNGKLLGSDDGRFSIGVLSLEYQNFTMNAKLLRTMSERSGGKFYTFENVSNFKDDLKNVRNFTEKSVVNKTETALWNLFWILIIVILLFSLEWFIRKRLGMV